MRKRWGINKIRENGDIHHAVDAVVIGCITNPMIKKISEYSKYRELEFVNPHTDEILDIDTRTGELVNRFPMPYDWFRDELIMRTSSDPTRVLHEKPLPNYATDEEVSPIFVSRMPKRKVSGAAHKDTIRRKYVNEVGLEYTVSKVPLSSLRLKNGEIEGYFNPSSDMLLYNALKSRLAMYDGDGKKAFADSTEPFRKPKHDGTDGPIVKKVKIQNKATLSVQVQNKTAIADNGSMVRVDVFFVENEGYYLVPVYVSDTVALDLPNRAIVGGKPYSKWKEMDNDNFVFSLYPNDLIKVKSKRDMKFNLVNPDSTLAKNYTARESMLYYKGTDISTAAITAINHDNTYKLRGLGVKSLLSIEKYSVDVLGNKTKVNKEKRMGFV